MKSIFVVTLALSYLLIATSGYASSNICSLASRALNMSKDQIDDFYKKNVQGRLITGSGKIVEIKKTGGTGISGNYQVTILCAPHVFVYIRASEHIVRKKKAKKGAVVTFSGECTKMYKGTSAVFCYVKGTHR